MSLDLNIIGDLNIDMCKPYSNKILSNFINNFELRNVVNNFTRVAQYGERITRSLIDVVLTNNKKMSEADTIDCIFSDHKFVLVITEYLNNENQFYHELFRNLNAANQKKIDEELSTINFNSIFHEENVNSKQEIFQNKILSIIDLVAPVKKVRIKVEKDN